MKLKLILLFIAFVCKGFSQIDKPLQSFFNDVDVFMKLYVSDAGEVNYSQIKRNNVHLDTLLNFVESINKNKLSSPDKEQAFLINSYNLFVIKGIISQEKLQSVMQTNGFFETKRYTLGEYGKRTLNEIENSLLLKKYKDPRFHFVLVCGAKGCPPLIAQGYFPETLNQQLDKQAKLAINNPSFIKVNETDKKLSVSQIFKWYAGDFGNIKAFLNKYSSSEITKDYKISYYPYNWELNNVITKEEKSSTGLEQSVIQAYTPSKLLKKGQLEIQYFNNVYTQTAFRDDKRQSVDLGNRATYYSGLFYALYGISKNRRINLGFDLNFKSVRVDPVSSTSPFRVLWLSNDEFSRTTITSIGPKIKLIPFKNSKISIQSAFWIPIADNLEADVSDANGNFKPWLDFDRYTWWNQFFYDKSIGAKYQLFLETDLLFRFGKGKNAYNNGVNKQSTLSTPLSTFFSYFPTKKSTIYLMGQYSPTFNLNENNGGTELSPAFKYANDFAQAGIGGKYQILTSLSLELSYTNFFTARNGGAGQTFNLGLRWLR